MNLFRFLSDVVADVVKKLGIIGTICYMGAMLLFILVLTVNFQTEVFKALILSGIGTALLVYSGIVYSLEKKEETIKVKEALGVLREVYNRAAEQISTADKDKTVSITMTIDNLPDKIAEFIHKFEKKQS